jgi:carbon starvation protein
MVSGWGYFLIQGVRDPLGGVNSLWPLFGIANQLLSVVALCLATTVILKMHLPPNSNPASPARPEQPGQTPRPLLNRPALALITLVPLVWLLCVTLSAGWAKIMDTDPRIGFLAEVKKMDTELPALQRTLVQAQQSNQAQAIAQARKEIRNNRANRFNKQLDAVVAGIFMVLVAAIVLLSLREWILLLARRRLATLHETAPVWLPDFALAAEKPMKLFHLLALALALARELSGEAAIARAQQAARAPDAPPPLSEWLDCACGHHHEPGFSPSGQRPLSEIYLEVAEKRFKGINRCC